MKRYTCPTVHCSTSYNSHYRGMYKDVMHIYNGVSWMNLEIIILNEVNQTQKDKYCMISLYVKPKKKDTKELIYKTELESQA